MRVGPCRKVTQRSAGEPTSSKVDVGWGAIDHHQIGVARCHEDVFGLSEGDISWLPTESVRSFTLADDEHGVTHG